VIAIREEGSADCPAVGLVHRAAFGRANEADLVDALRRSARPQLSLVAEQDGRVCGHVFFSPLRIASDAPAPPAAGLAPLGVLPAFQGRGVGAALVEGGLERCRALGWKAVFLIGDPDYYGRFGFALAAPLGFRYRSEHFDPVLQVFELEPGSLAGRGGAVHYHPAFEASGTG